MQTFRRIDFEMKYIAFYTTLIIAFFSSIDVHSQVMTLEECRALALKNNKQLAIQRTKETIAKETKEVTKTLYLPRFDMVGTYLHTSKKISLLNGGQQSALSNLGTSLVNGAAPSVEGLMNSLVSQNIITMEQAGKLGAIISQMSPQLKGALDQVGENIVDALHTDTRNMWVGSVALTQPIFMGGRITAANKIADINMEMAANQTEASMSNIILNTDKAYWLVVSLKHKFALAQSYHELLKKLQDDVSKMVREGIATKSDQLNVDVKVNDAEMTLTQVEDGLVLSKMALCQVCGIPVDSQITLKDELNTDIEDDGQEIQGTASTAIANRAEIKMLGNLAEIAEQGVKVAKADYLPTVALTAGYMVSNPSLVNGFQRKFRGLWNVGVMLNMPLWHWNDTKHKINIAKSSTLLANMQQDDAKNLITLQVSQDQFKLKEARKKLSMTNDNMKSADENLRSANMGFKEGLFTVTTVMEAQTAWMKASNQKIDAQIDVKLALSELKEALGI